MYVVVSSQGRSQSGYFDLVRRLNAKLNGWDAWNCRIDGIPLGHEPFLL